MTENGERQLVDVGWEQARSANLENWEDRVPVHEPAYDLDGFRADPDRLSDVARVDLQALAPFLPAGSVRGLDVCHLQCHLGTDTLSFARAGARVTGVDFSPSALASAARLAADTGLLATWVEADVLTARAAVTGDFDVVYSSIGSLCWLPDLARWAEQVAALLCPGGICYLRDTHPVLYALDPGDDDLRIRHPYFGSGRAIRWDVEHSYVGEGALAHPRMYLWPHSLAEVVNALIGAGLVLLRLDESRSLPWQFHPRMVPVGNGEYAWPGAERDLVPGTFTVVARRPPG